MSDEEYLMAACGLSCPPSSSFCNCLYIKTNKRIPKTEWKCPKCSSSPDFEEEPLDGGSLCCGNPKCKQPPFHWCALTEKYEMGSPIHREDEISNAIEKKQKIEEQEVVEKKPKPDVDYVALYVLNLVFGIDRSKEEDPLLGDLNVSKDDLKETFKYIFDNYEKLEKNVNLPFHPKEE